MLPERTEEFYTDALLGEKAQVSEHDGALWIEGWAADISLDDQDEYFSYDALKAGAEAFVASGNMPLLYHHKPDMQLGEITQFEARQEGDRAGIWMKARIDPTNHPILSDVYDKVKRGTMKGLSVAGRFFGEPTANGWKIARAHFRETSVTPFPVNPRTLATVTGKAVEAFEDCGDCEERAKAEQAVTGMRGVVLALETIWEGLQQKSAPTAEQRKKFGMHPGGEFPIWHCGTGPGSVKSALHLAGHSKLPKTKVMAHIRGRASDLGCPQQVKDTDSHKD